MLQKIKGLQIEEEVGLPNGKYSLVGSFIVTVSTQHGGGKKMRITEGINFTILSYEEVFDGWSIEYLNERRRVVAGKLQKRH